MLRNISILKYSGGCEYGNDSKILSSGADMILCDGGNGYCDRRNVIGEGRIDDCKPIFKIFKLSNMAKQISSLNLFNYLVCAGERLECSKANPCSEWQGNCSDFENHSDCQIGLRCGNSNCRTKHNGRMALSNCCFKAQGLFKATSISSLSD